MSMKDHANNILNTIENDLFAARKRKRYIEVAMEMLANAGVPDDILNPLRFELEDAMKEFTECLIHRMLVKSGMRNHNWLDD